MSKLNRIRVIAQSGRQTPVFHKDANAAFSIITKQAYLPSWMTLIICGELPVGHRPEIQTNYVTKKVNKL